MVSLIIKRKNTFGNMVINICKSSILRFSEQMRKKYTLGKNKFIYNCLYTLGFYGFAMEFPAVVLVN